MKTKYLFSAIIIFFTLGVFAGLFLAKKLEEKSFAAIDLGEAPEKDTNFLNINITTDELEGLLKKADKTYWETEKKIRELDDSWAAWFAGFIMKELDKKPAVE